jgi:hypothetical protein
MTLNILGVGQAREVHSTALQRTSKFVGGVLVRKKPWALIVENQIMVVTDPKAHTKKGEKSTHQNP